MSEVKNLDTQLPVYPPYINAYTVEDEISLVDIWIALLKFKKVFFGSFILLLVIGIIVVGVFMEDKYNMTSSIAIGQVKNGNLLAVMIPPSDVVSRLRISVLPRLTKGVTEREGWKLFETSVANPKNTNLVVIDNKVSEARQNVITQFQKTMVNMVLENHRELSLLLNATLEQELEAAKFELEKLQNPLQLSTLTEENVLLLEQGKMEWIKLTDDVYLESLKSDFLNKIKLREEEVLALERKTHALEAQIDALRASPSSRYEKALITEEISNNEVKISQANLKKLDVQRKYADFKLETRPKAAKQRILNESLRNKIKLTESTWKADIEKLKSKVVELQSELEGRRSRAISIAELSLEPVGLTRSNAFVIVVLLAIMGAFFITLLAIFRTKVIERMVEEA